MSGLKVSLNTLRAELGSAGPVYIKPTNGGAVRLIDCFRLSENDDSPWELIVEAGPGSGWKTGTHKWVYQASALVELADSPTLNLNTPEAIEEFLDS